MKFKLIAKAFNVNVKNSKIQLTVHIYNYTVSSIEVAGTEPVNQTCIRLK